MDEHKPTFLHMNKNYFQPIYIYTLRKKLSFINQAPKGKSNLSFIDAKKKFKLPAYRKQVCNNGHDQKSWSAKSKSAHILVRMY